MSCRQKSPFGKQITQTQVCCARVDAFPDASLKVESKGMRHMAVRLKVRQRERRWYSVWGGPGWMGHSPGKSYTVRDESKREEQGVEGQGLGKGKERGLHRSQENVSVLKWAAREPHAVS